MDRFGRFLVSLAVGAACFYGPFTHIHNPGQAESHVASEHISAGIAFHIHLGVRDTDDPSWCGSDESAHSLEWFQFEQARDGLSAPPPQPFGLRLEADASRDRLPDAAVPAPEPTGSSPPSLRGPPAIG